MVDAPTLEECHEKFSVSEFKEYLNDDYLSSKENRKGWVFWRPDRADESSGSNNINNSMVSQGFGESIQEKIRLALDKVTSESFIRRPQYAAQFWAPIVIGGRCWLTTLGPFAVRYLDKGSCWYRRRCMNHYYVIDNGAKEEELGPPERVFRNGHPESSADLRLYSVKEFPLRDIVAHPGFEKYLALPVFDLWNQCVGVFEVVFSSRYYGWWSVTDFLPFQRALEEAGLRSTHNLEKIYVRDIMGQNTKYKRKPPKEIREMLELAIKVLPQLHLAQVWVPCNQCTNPASNHLSCMEHGSP